MNKNPNQSEINATFKSGIAKSRLEGMFSQKAAAIVATAVLAKLHKPDGTEIVLSPVQTDILAAMFYQTSESRIKIIKTILSEAGVELDKTTESQIRKLFNPAAVEKGLKDMENPEKKTLRDFLV